MIRYLPLSPHMVGIVQRALKEARRRDHRYIVLEGEGAPSETGHILRHTFRTAAKRADIGAIEARLLVDHTRAGHRRRVHPQQRAVRPPIES